MFMEIISEIKKRIQNITIKVIMPGPYFMAGQPMVVEVSVGRQTDSTVPTES